MTKLYFTLILLTLGLYLNSQSLDFQNTTYFTASGNTLASSGQTLYGFNYNTASLNHPLFTDGIYFPVKDYQDNNLWVRVRHIAADPNGTSVGVNVTATCGDPFRAGFGGWAGFLYQFEIYKDAAFSGAPSNFLNGLYPANISIESIETLSYGEIVSFELLNTESSPWSLNSINFTGNNPTSNPGFSTSTNYWPGSQPPPGFSTTFPSATKKINVVDYGSGGYYAEFKVSADDVSSFNYGYEFIQLCNGYQGMRMSFGIKSVTPLKLLSFDGNNTNNISQLQWTTSNEENTSTFLIQRSTDGIHFYEIGHVSANNLPGVNNYTYADKSSSNNGAVYYRLKQVDRDGKFSLSHIIKLLSPFKETLSIRQSINGQKLTVASLEENGILKIFNNQGQMLINQKITTSIADFNTSEWPSGTYFVEYLSKSGVRTKKVMIMH